MTAISPRHEHKQQDLDRPPPESHHPTYTCHGRQKVVPPMTCDQNPLQGSLASAHRPISRNRSAYSGHCKWNPRVVDPRHLHTPESMMCDVGNKRPNEVTGLAARFIAETNAFLEQFWARPNIGWPLKLAFLRFLRRPDATSATTVAALGTTRPSDRTNHSIRRRHRL